jgi:NADPH2:quinone reductase
MRAVGIMVHGGPEVLQVVDVPGTHAGPGQVRIQVQAAAVNPTDVMARNGSRAEQQSADPPPYVPGMDAAGVVDQVGEGVTTGVKVGDVVMAMVVPKACTLPMNGLTARQSLDLLGLKPGQVLAVTGGPGAYGGYVIQLAKLEGLTVIADAAPADEALLKTLGVDIIVPRSESFFEKIRAHFPDGVDGLADGALLNEKAISAVKDGGAFTSIRFFIGEPQRDIRFTATSVRNYDGEYEKLDRLRQLVEEGSLTLRVADTVPPGRASEAHARLEAGGTRGRMVITF